VEDRALYQVGDIHLAPITSGAGLNLKVAIPLWNGLRVITTREGSNGFRKIPAMSVCQTHKDFAEKIPLYRSQNYYGHNGVLGIVHKWEHSKCLGGNKPEELLEKFFDTILKTILN
jgi:hypothetical protein